MTTALLIIDMLNRFDFPEGDALLRRARSVAKTIARLKARAKKKKTPVIYVNDNLGQWRSDWRQVYEECTAPDAKGREIASILRPDDDDYVVLKSRHSGFFATNLDVLLRELGVKKLVVTGVAADVCILFTVYDAKMRDYEVVLPADAIEAETAAKKTRSLRQMKDLFEATVPRNSASARFL